MQFLLLDKLTNEFTGLFNTKDEAEFYYLKKYIVERLRVYMYKLIGKTELMENIELIREFENIISEINSYEKDDDYSLKYNYFIHKSDNLLFKCVLDAEIHKKISSTNYKLFIFKEDEFNIFKTNN